MRAAPIRGAPGVPRWRLLAAAGALALAAAWGSSPAAAAGPATVAGWAHLTAGLPVEGARVEVRTLGGRRLKTIGTARTSRNGTFGFTVERLPGRYVIVVRGGRAGGLRLPETLETVVVGGRRFRLAHVNPATTLAARYFLHHPGQSWRDVSRRVRRYLKLPEGVALEASLRRSGRHFDGARFLAAAAREEGSLAAFVARLEREVERGWSRPFHGREHRGTAGRRTLAAAFPITPSGLLTAAVNGAVSSLAGDGVGWLLGALGFGQSDEIANVESQLQAMQGTLTQVELQLDSLEQAVNGLEATVAQSEYTQLASQLAGLDGVGSATDNVLNDLVYLADHALGTCAATSALACVSPIPAGDDPLVWCQTSVAAKTPLQAAACDALRTISASYQTPAESTLAGVLQGENGADGLIVAFQKARYAWLVAARGFVTPAYVADAQTVIDYWTWKQALLASYYGEYGHAEGLPGGVLQTTLAGYQADLADEQALIAKGMPDTTFIDTRTGRMWALVDFSQVYAPGEAWGQVTSWGLDGSCVFPDRSPYLWDLAHPLLNKTAELPGCEQALLAALDNYLGFDDWVMPRLADVQGMIAGWSGATVADWLTAQAGLPSLAAVASYPVPAPDPTLFPSTVWTDGVYHANPGTALAVHDLSTCTDRAWGVGTLDVDPDTGQMSPVFVQGAFCDYVRLTDGSVGHQCVRSDPNYSPCNTPVLVNAMNESDGPLDFGHPGVMLLWRTPPSAEGWFRD